MIVVSPAPVPNSKDEAFTFHSLLVRLSIVLLARETIQLNDGVALFDFKASADVTEPIVSTYPIFVLSPELTITPDPVSVTAVSFARSPVVKIRARSTEETIVPDPAAIETPPIANDGAVNSFVQTILPTP